MLVGQERQEEGLGTRNDFTVVLTWERSLHTVVGIRESFFLLIFNPKWSFHCQLF